MFPRLELEFDLPDNPIPLNRARKGRSLFYDPQMQVKQNIRDYVKNKHKIEIKPFDCPIHLEVECFFKMPKSWSKKKRASLNGYAHTNNIDLDNLIKMIGDTFNGVLWTDDRLIYSTKSIKLWSEEPATVVRIYCLH